MAETDTRTRAETLDEPSPGRPPERTPPHPGMVWLPSATFRMGSNDHYPEERPVHRVTVDGFWIDIHR